MLTDAQLRKLTTKGKVKTVTDGLGLSIAVYPTGKKVFRFRYRHPITQRSQILTIGSYPLISLSDARIKRDEAKNLLSQKIDPCTHKKESNIKKVAEQKRLDNRLTLNQLYDEYCQFKTVSHGGNPPQWQESTLNKHHERFNNFVLPVIGDAFIEDLTENDLEECLLKIQQHGTLSNLKKVRTVFNGMFDLAKAKRYIERNIAKYITSSLFIKATPKHFKHVTSKQGVMMISSV